MPEDQNQAPAEQPTPQQAAEPAAAPAATTAAPKKTNGCLIAVIVVAVLIVLSGIGIFVAYRFVKNKVKDVVSTDNGSTSINIGDNKGSVSNTSNSYADTTDQTPTVTLIKNVNDQLRPIFAELFSGAKTNSWTSVDQASGTLSYITKNKVTSADYAKIKDKLITLGYSSTSDYNSSDGSMMIMDKGTLSLTIYLNVTDQADNIVVTVSEETQPPAAE